MNQIQLLFKRLRTAAFAAAMLFGTSAVFAQVKIGANPTTIEATSNLEVEASTAGRKVKVNKTTGQVTIADGTQGAGKVLTSDANGGASWQKGIACNSIQVKRSTDQTVPINNSIYDPGTNLISNTVTYDPTNSYNTTTGVYTVPSTGYYVFVGSSVDHIDGVTTSSRNSTLGIASNLQGSLASTVQQNLPYNNGTYQNVTGMAYCTAGEQIRFIIQVTHTTGTKPSPTINASNIKFSATRMDCNSN